MRTVDLITRKRNGEELLPEEITWLVDSYTRGEIPEYQMSAFLMAVYFQNMSEQEVEAMTAAMLASGGGLDLSDVPGPRVDKHSTGGVGDKTSLIAAPLAAAAGVVVPMVAGRALGHTGGTLDKLEAIPGFNTKLTVEQFKEQLRTLGIAIMGQTEEVTPADGKMYSLRDATGTVESTALIAASIMSKKLAVSLDGLVLDVKVGAGAFMKRQVEARKLAQLMTTIARRNDLRAQALLTDMNQPLGFAIGNALEVMEVSQTLLNAGPPDLTRLSLELAARMIFLAKLTETLEDAREVAQARLLDGSGFKKLRDVIAAQGGDPMVLDRFDMLPNATGAMEITAPRGGYVSAIDAEEIGLASAMIGAGRDTKEDSIDPAVGVILQVKAGEKVDEGGVLCRIYYTKEDRLEEAAERVEDAFRLSSNPPEPRELILEVVS
ncbi:MAG: thymidine phosphorylase [Bryobacteraceae bacterium]|nr:thymidine phosphorylase [Solibacteraceae bacterium]MCL4844868.1 thymidine phosphorylase [Bryobacteraceae bacterium]MCO5353117.1 thymidine phosphorylase [Bryobacteraceae bacterium]HAX43795.1 thymidine phosphorylase [Bryobacterales bacterium]HRJ18153.1 thymidine phosphorylase [Bryobacteraceae bacterium]